MIKCKIYVYSDNNWCDKNVFIIIELPSVPLKEDFLNLSQDLICQLEEKAKVSKEILQDYIDYFYRGSSNIVKVTDESIDDFSFDDIGIVKEVLYTANSEFIEIILTH